MNSRGPFSSLNSVFKLVIRKTSTRPGNRLSLGYRKIIRTWSLPARSLLVSWDKVDIKEIMAAECVV